MQLIVSVYNFDVFKNFLMGISHSVCLN